MARKIGAVIALDGEQQFKNAVTACTKSLNNMKSALKLVETQTAGQKNSLEALQKKHDALNNVLGASKSKQEAIRQEFEKSKQKYEDIGKKLDEYKDNLAESREKLEKMKASGEATDEELAKQEEAVKKAADAVDRAERSYESAGNKAEDWQRRLNDATAETAKAEQAVGENAEAMEELEKATDGAGGELDEFADRADDAEKSTGELEISLKSMIKNAAVGLLADGFKELASKAGEAAKYVMRVGSDFEAGMSKVGAVSGASSKEMEQLSAKAKQMGATTKFSATEAAEAMNYMAMAGWKTEDMLQGVEGIMYLAAASGEELATTSDIVTDALTAFGKSAEESGRLADIMAAASSNANTNVSMMGETFKYAAPVAGALGASMEDTAVAVGLMANSGIKASQAGTALRTGLSNLAKPTKQMKEWMDKYNISLIENEDGSVNLRETMVQLREKMGQLSETEQAAAASAIFGKNAMSGWMAIINSSDEDFNKLADAIDNSDGAAKEMMETMGDNLQGKIKLLEASLEGLGIALYDKISGPLKIAVEAAAGAISGLTEVLQDHRDENQLAVDQIKAANEEIQKSVENSKGIVESAMIDAGRIDVLAEALMTLNEQENLSASEKANLKDAYDKLVEIVPELAGHYNEETGKIDLTREAIEKLTKARKEEIIEQGRMKAHTELLEAMGEAQGKLELAMAKAEGMKTQKKMWEDLQKTLTDARDEYARLINKYGETADLSSLDDIKDRLMGIAQEALNAGAINTDTYDRINETFKAMSDGWSEAAYENAWAILQEELEACEGSMGDLDKAVEEAKKGYEDASHEVKMLENATKSHTSAVDEATVKYATALDAEKAIREAIEGMTEATEDNTEATHNSTKKTKEEIGVIDDSANSVNELAKEKQDLKEVTEDYVESTEDETDALEEAVKAAHDAAESQKTLRDAYNEARDDMRKAFEDIKKSAEDAFKINPFDQWSQDAEKGMLAFEEAMKSQRDGLLRYKDNLTTVKDNLGSVAPEFVQYLEDMGQGGAQLVAEFADAFRTGNADVVYRLMDEYKQAMDIREDTANIIEQDKLALQLGLESLSPEAITAWEDLGYAFDEGVAVVQAKGGEVSQATIDSFWGAVDACKAVGIEAPAQLAEGIRNAEDPEQAIADAASYLTEQLRGKGQGLLDAANELGIAIPAEIANTIADPEASQEQVQTAVDSLVGMIKTKQPDFDAAGAEAGEGMAGNAASGITGKTADVEGSTKDLINSAKTAGSNAAPTFKAVGTSMMSMLNLGMLEKKQDIVSRVESNLLQAKTNAVTTVSDTYKSLGEHMIGVLATGMGDATSQVTGKVVEMVGQVQTKLTEMTTAVSNACRDMAQTVSSTYLRFPNIEIPHVRWTWDRITYGNGDWTEVPNFYVSWYAKAMEQGMILDNPTIFGMMNGKFLGAGEAGSETVVGTNSLMSMIETAVQDAVAPEAAFDDVSQRLDTLISVLGQYMPQILDATQSGMVLEPDGNYMGRFRKRLSSEMAMDTRRARA